MNKDKQEYKYLVVCSMRTHKKGILRRVGRYMGNLIVTRDTPLNTMKRIRDLEKHLEHVDGYASVVITNVIRLEE